MVKSKIGAGQTVLVTGTSSGIGEALAGCFAKDGFDLVRVARGHGRILNVASIAAFQPIPTLATYAATKAYVLSLTESLAVEMKGSGVSITALCPGITATNMPSAAASPSGKLTRLPGFLIGEVNKVAMEGYEACIKGDVIKVPGAINLAAILAGRATPKWLLRRVSGTLGRKSI